jgi:DNA-binding CsgD family transcriptional regulator
LCSSRSPPTTHCAATQDDRRAPRTLRADPHRALAERAHAELYRAGARTPAVRASGPADRLTPSERRAAELAAAGQTNRQIADALFVTVKAVEWHLGNVYRKLDAHSRAELPHKLAHGSAGSR